MKGKYKLGCLFIVILIAAVGFLFSGFLFPQSAEKWKSKCILLSTLSKKQNDGGKMPEDWELILVNSDHPLPENFSVSLKQLRNGQSVDSRIYPDLQNMFDDMRSEGLAPLICSSYRTQKKQERLYENQIQKYIDQGYSYTQAETEASKWSAKPGSSEHQTGLAVDIIAVSYQILDEKQEQTAEQAWLMQNCWKYGFILRYPLGKEEITGIAYEPWHYRYVGYAAAKEITEKGMCLEEYLKEYSLADSPAAKGAFSE